MNIWRDKANSDWLSVGMSKAKTILLWASSTLLTLGALARVFLTLPPSLDLMVEITMAILAAALLGVWILKED